MKTKVLFFCLLLLIGTLIVSGALAAQKIELDSSASLKLADSLAYDRTQNDIVYYKDAKNRVSCGYRVSGGQLTLADVKATLKKSGYTSVKIKTVSGVKTCSGKKKANGLVTLMTYFNTTSGNFVMLAFTYDPAKTKAQKIVDNGIASIRVAKAVPSPLAPPFSWTGTGSKKVTSVKYGGKDLILIYMRHVSGYEDYITYYLDTYKASLSQLKEKGVKVLVCLLDADKASLKSIAAKYPSMVFGRAASTDEKLEMWTALERLGDSAESVKYPVVFLRSRSNRLRYFETGSIDNAKTIVKKALAMVNDNVQAVPPDPEELILPEDDGIIAVEHGKFRISGATATFLGVVGGAVTELEIPPMITYNGVAYPVTEIAANACKGLTSLVSLQIDSNVAKIGKNAFRNCKNLNTIVFLTAKLKKAAVGANAFKNIADQPVVKCPRDVMKSYKEWLMEKGVPQNASFVSIRVK